MVKKYENDFKVMIVELLKSGRKAKEQQQQQKTQNQEAQKKIQQTQNNQLLSSK